MKKIFASVLATFALSAFSQSYLIMDNGIVITTDKAGFTYDLGHYSFPQKITLKGGRYFVEDNSVLATIDENGLLFRKYEIVPEKVIGKGINYFLSETGDLFTIDKRGILITAEHPELSMATVFGGTFFFVPVDEEKKLADLFVVNQDGQQNKALPSPVLMSEIVAIGGTYYMNNRGIVHTISADGVVTARPEVRAGVIMKKGGNYFVDSSGTLYTIAQDGTLKIPAIPVNLRTGTITKLGSDYFLDVTGKLFVVDHEGNVFERVMRDHDFRHARIISL